MGRDPSPSSGSPSSHSARLEVNASRQKFPGFEAPLHPDERVAWARVRVGQLGMLSIPSTLSTSFEKSTISEQSSAHRVASQSRRGTFRQEIGGAEDAVAAAIVARSITGRSCRGRERSLTKIQEEKSRLQEHPGSVQDSPILMVELEQLQMTPLSSPKRHKGLDCEKILFQRATRTSCGGWEQQGTPRVGEIVPSCGECSGGFVADINSINGREGHRGIASAVVKPRSHGQ